MKILHCCLACFYVDNFGYQENIIPRMHKRLGHEVTIVASTESFDDKGQLTYLDPSSYLNEDGIPVTRLPYIKYLPSILIRKLRKYKGLPDQLKSIQPDIIFLHDVQFLDIEHIVKYVKKNPNTTVFADCHTDFSNSAKNWLSKNILHKVIYRRCAKIIEPYCSKFYGVLPARVDFLKTVYKLPPEKCELLVMGADDELVESAEKPEIKAMIRKKHNIAPDDFLIITGGKIDTNKPQTIQLMEAVMMINNPMVRLIVFGSVIPELMNVITMLADGIKIQYIGWVQSSETYKYFASADLAVFPGLHSVFWEQVVGQGIPIIVKHVEGAHHIDFGGNCDFLYDDSTEEIFGKINDLLDNKGKYQSMNNAAQSDLKREFSYKDIARRCIS